MKQLSVPEELYKKLLTLKNHYTFTSRKITNSEALAKLEEAKKRIFGYNNKSPKEEIEKIIKTKTRAELEEESEKFAKFYKELISSGIDFEPEYRIEEHLKKIIEMIESENSFEE